MRYIGGMPKPDSREMRLASLAQARSNRESESLLGEVEHLRARVTELQRELQRVSYTLAQVQSR